MAATEATEANIAPHESQQPDDRAAPPAEQKEVEAEAEAAAGAGSAPEEKQLSPGAEKKKRGRKKAGENGDSVEEGSQRKRKLLPKSVASPAKEMPTPPTEGGRPSRERKAVERYSDAASPPKSSASKSVTIPEGSGTKLRDIPNVFYKISKRKSDLSLQALHALLFWKKGKAHNLKKNILQFSGFVWSQDGEDKLKTKLKEKVFKFNKEKLIDFCGILDIPILASTKKEEICVKLIEFLESPHATRDVILAESEQRKRKKKRIRMSKATSQGRSKKPKTSPPESQRKDSSLSPAEGHAEEGADVSGDASDDKDASSGEGSDSETEGGNDVSDEEKNEPEGPVPSKKEFTPKAKSTGKTTGKPKKSPTKSVGKKALAAGNDIGSTAETKLGSQKKPREQTRLRKSRTRKIESVVKSSPKKKSSSKEGDSVMAETSKVKKSGERKGQGDESKKVEKENKNASTPSKEERGKGTTSTSATKGPSREDLYSVISDILKEVDFDTVTLADLIKQLGAHFNADLMDRKAEVKSIIEEVINSMSDDEAGDNDDAKDDESE